jgi:hypothetical protein
MKNRPDGKCCPSDEAYVLSLIEKLYGAKTPPPGGVL